MLVTLTKNDLVEYIGNPLLHNELVEEVLIKNYCYNRRNGIDYVELLKVEFLSKGFNATVNEINSDSVIPYSKLLTVTYSILDKLDVLILMSLNDLNFKDISYVESIPIEDNIEYKFEVMYGNK